MVPTYSDNSYRGQLEAKKTMKVYPKITDQLMTDRSAYISYLESQLERVTASCMTAQAVQQRMAEVDGSARSLEDKLRGLARLVKVNQEYSEEQDRAVKAVADRIAKFEAETCFFSGVGGSSGPGGAGAGPGATGPGLATGRSAADAHLDLRVLDAKFRGWAQNVEAKLDLKLQDIERRMTERLEAVMADTRTQRPNLQQQVERFKDDMVSRLGDFKREVGLMVEDRAVELETRFLGLRTQLQDSVAADVTRIESAVQRVTDKAASREDVRKAFDAAEALSSLRDVFQDDILAMNRERTRLTQHLEALKATVEELSKAGQVGAGGGAGEEGDWYVKEQMARRVGEALNRLEAAVGREFDQSSDALKRVQGQIQQIYKEVATTTREYFSNPLPDAKEGEARQLTWDEQVKGQVQTIRGAVTDMKDGFTAVRDALRVLNEGLSSETRTMIVGQAAGAGGAVVGGAAAGGSAPGSAPGATGGAASSRRPPLDLLAHVMDEIEHLREDIRGGHRHSAMLQSAVEDLAGRVAEAASPARPPRAGLRPAVGVPFPGTAPAGEAGAASRGRDTVRVPEGTARRSRSPSSASRPRLHDPRPPFVVPTSPSATDRIKRIRELEEEIEYQRKMMGRGKSRSRSPGGKLPASGSRSSTPGRVGRTGCSSCGADCSCYDCQQTFHGRSLDQSTAYTSRAQDPRSTSAGAAAPAAAAPRAATLPPAGSRPRPVSADRAAGRFAAVGAAEDAAGAGPESDDLSAALQRTVRRRERLQKLYQELQALDRP